MKRLFITATTLLILALPASILLAQKVPEDTDIHTVDLIEEDAAPVRKFTIPDNYPRICRRFATLVSSHHLLQKPFNNTISAQAWTNYLRILDYERSYFTQADIDTFEQYRLRMSDDLVRGDLEFPIKAYELLKKRHGERLAFVKAMLSTNIDFTVEESFEWKRKDAPWCRDQEEMDELWRKRVKNDVLSRIVTRDYAESNRVETAAASTNAVAVVKSPESLESPESPEGQKVDNHTAQEPITTVVAPFNPSHLDPGPSGPSGPSDAAASTNAAALDLSPEATVRRHYEQSDIIVQDTDAESVIQSYLNAFCAAYDPHTAYMAPAANDDFNIDMNLRLAGIGATLQPEDGAAKVVKVIPGSPVSRDTRDIRLMKDDKIIGVGQDDGPIEDITHLPLSKSSSASAVRRARRSSLTSSVRRVIRAGSRRALSTSSATTSSLRNRPRRDASSASPAI